MTQEICRELFKFEDHCIQTGQLQVAELAHDAQKEIQVLRARLAAYERATIQRDESVPEWAVRWSKSQSGFCAFYPAISLAFEEAPDLRPDEPGPITLPIVDVE